MKSDDKFTLFLTKAIDILLLKHPMRTSVGILFGFVIQGVAGLFTPVLSKLSWIAPAKLKLWHFVPAGIITAHTPSFLDFLKNKPVGNESIDEAFEVIRKAPIPDIQKKVYYRALIKKTLDDVVLNDKTQKKLDIIEAKNAFLNKETKQN